MKYVCMGYHDERAWSGLTEAERNAFLEECSSYADRLRADGNLAGGESLDDTASAVTVRYRNGRVQVSDGPLALSREQLGGLFFLEAKDLDHAIQLISKHPGVRGGPFEIRPVAALEATGGVTEGGNGTGGGNTNGGNGRSRRDMGDIGTFFSGGDRRSP